MTSCHVVLINSCQQTSTQILYRLLAHPEYIKPLRREVDTVIKEEGWTKAGIDKMYKIDSFVRETLRIDGFTIRSLNFFLIIPSPICSFAPRFFLVPFIRLALRPFTFSNGVTVPAGTFVAIPSSATNTDERIYPNANEFDGFRFDKLRKTERGSMNSGYQAVSTSSEHLFFGFGRHAW
jgi:cytochrome P450